MHTSTLCSHRLGTSIVHCADVFCRYASSVGATHFYTSAKAGIGINEAFLDLTKRSFNLLLCISPVALFPSLHIVAFFFVVLIHVSLIRLGIVARVGPSKSRQQSRMPGEAGPGKTARGTLIIAPEAGSSSGGQGSGDKKSGGCC